MRIVIDIPEDHYKQICENKEDAIIAHDTCRRIAHGIPLPKGHGRLIDAEDVKNNHEKWIGYLDDDMIARLNIAVDKHIPTIIEADKESE